MIKKQILMMGAATVLLLMGAATALAVSGCLSCPVTITYSPEPGYADAQSIVAPTIGQAGITPFVFKAVYTSVDNLPPTDVSVNFFVHYLGATTTQPSQQAELDISSDASLHDGNYANGEQYSLTTTLPPGTYRVAFEAHDGFTSGAFSDGNAMYVQLGADDPLDNDGDGIYDPFDTVLFTYSDAFTDATTTGNIISRGDQFVSVKDATSTSNGVVLAARANHILAIGAASSTPATSTPATISACGNTAEITLTDGDAVTLTCGSVTLNVLAGEVEAKLFADDGSISFVRVSAGNTMTFHPAENTISAAPENKGAIIATINGTELTILPIDVKPGTTDNAINLNAGGVVPVAILTTPAFDAREVDALSVTLLGAPVRLKGKSGNAGSLVDVDGDGDLDLVVHIENTLLLVEGQTWAMLEGTTYTGGAIRGSDSIRIVP